MGIEAGEWDTSALLRESDWLRGLALRLVQDAARADDLVQDALLAALQRQPREDRGLRPWLARVLRNRWASGRRREVAVRKREEERARGEALPSEVELLARAEVRRELADALTRLREPYRSVLLLRFHEGLEPAEIARRRGVPAATVRSQLSRGLAELRERLDRHADRRSWSLALVPLAASAGERAAGVGAGVAGLAVALVVTGVAFSVALAWFPWSRTGRPGVVPAVPAVPAAPGDAVRSVVATVAETGPAGVGGGEAVAAVSPRAALPGAQRGASRIEGTLVHVRSGRPLRHFAFDVLRDGAPPVRVWTDGAGRFSCDASAGPVQSVQFDFLDHPDLDGTARCGIAELALGMSVMTARWQPAAEPIELKAPGGAEYGLELTAGDAGAARALAGGSAGFTATLRARPDGSRPLFAEDWTFRAPLRTAGEGAVAPERTWVRFPPTHGVLPTSGTWVVGVESADGLVGGEVEVSPGDDPDTPRLPLELVGRARLDVALVSSVDLEAPEVVLERDGGPRVLDVAKRRVLSDGRREWIFRGSALAPGRVRLHVRCEGVEPVRRDLALVAGEVLATEVALEPDGSDTTLAGELRSESGSFQERMFVRLRDELGRPVGVVQPRWNEVDGAWVAPFRFQDLDPGSYLLDLRSSLSHRRWSPAATVVAPPLHDLVLVCHDEEPVRGIAFQATDAETGDACDFSLTVDLPGCAPSMTELRTARGKVLSGVPDAVDVDWFVHAPGYAPRWGRRSDLRPDGQGLCADVVLTRGWGARIVARVAGAEGHAEGLAGVEVLLDGVVAGVTDARGRLDLVREAAPRHVELRHASAAFRAGDHDPDAGTLTGTGGVHTVRFEL